MSLTHRPSDDRRPTHATAVVARPAMLVVLLVGLVLVACSSDAGSSGHQRKQPVADRAARTYLSLGDSYAQGYQPPINGKAADYTRGYANLIPKLAQAKGYDLKLVNFGCGGATVESMAKTPGCAAPARATDGPVYEKTQLQAAVDYLDAHQGEVQLITVSIGGNDVTKCARGAADPIACVTDAVETISTQLGPILDELRSAAGPDTTIVGLTYPDVILGAYNNPSTRNLAELSVVAFKQFINPKLDENYQKINATFVDVTAGTGAYTPLTETTDLAPYGTIPKAVAEVCRLTWFCEKTDIHPKDAGYAKIADLIVAALPEA